MGGNLYADGIAPSHGRWVERYVLRDGEAAHAAHPDTFEIPDLDERQHLHPGTYAKLMFDFGADGVERMWVEVTHCDCDPNGNALRYLGNLGNQPAFTDAMDFGDRVEFEPKHVISVMKVD